MLIIIYHSSVALGNCQFLHDVALNGTRGHDLFQASRFDLSITGVTNSLMVRLGLIAGPETSLMLLVPPVVFPATTCQRVSNGPQSRFYIGEDNVMVWNEYITALEHFAFHLQFSTQDPFGTRVKLGFLK